MSSLNFLLANIHCVDYCQGCWNISARCDSSSMWGRFSCWGPLGLFQPLHWWCKSPCNWKFFLFCLWLQLECSLCFLKTFSNIHHSISHSFVGHIQLGWVSNDWPLIIMFACWRHCNASYRACWMCQNCEEIQFALTGTLVI